MNKQKTIYYHSSFVDMFACHFMDSTNASLFTGGGDTLSFKAKTEVFKQEERVMIGAYYVGNTTGIGSHFTKPLISF
jgi:hypothetical protein